MIEIKPCPFCGEKTEIAFKIEGHYKPWENDGEVLWYTCYCYQCGAAMDDGGYRDKKKAVEAWNERG